MAKKRGKRYWKIVKIPGNTTGSSRRENEMQIADRGGTLVFLANNFQVARDRRPAIRAYTA
jgi:hypothetical protein